MTLIAALPMYDWPEMQSELRAQWQRMRGVLLDNGYDAPERLVSRNGDLPAVPGGIRDRAGNLIAPDPATLPPDELDLPTLWLHPALLITQTCWGPMELGIQSHVHLAGQDDYSGIEGGDGSLYSSALVMRRAEGRAAVAAPEDGKPVLPLELLRGKRLAFNSHDSMSGYLALQRDLVASGESLAIFAGELQTGGHRASVAAVASGKADVAAIDCKSWARSQRFDAAAATLAVVGWTGRRKGLPFISALPLPAHLFA
ncbi:PhnD/SsuA/transferrin family substrate-binding protein [Phyllobacterium pellucidum]|uniref:PhnD/SsuA/transferrin family substrate-binding protein n=1 Tax=Phyllobacterium pellucidum TaxID=2740464 RepID=UPI001D1446BE|nr:PhnD/SsuA/transferrin family substrate-binding protein [Phyllobacterium sp. T1018]UGY09119.1 PhnD/SsuA/transferrin family substrate-binding protein [Phyllobacterium sp. T1018]